MRATVARLAIFGVFISLIFLAARAETTLPAGVRRLAPDVSFWQGDHLLKQPANCTWIVFKDYVLAIDANFPGPARDYRAHPPDHRPAHPLPVRHALARRSHRRKSGVRGCRRHHRLLAGVRRRAAHQGPEGPRPERAAVAHVSRPDGFRRRHAPR